MTQNPSKIPSFLDKHKIRVALGVMLIATIWGGVSFLKSSAMADRNADQAALSHALSVTTMSLHKRHHYQVKQKYAGNIVARRESDHGFDRPGLLAEILVDEGDMVKKGDILARLDMRPFRTREAEQKAALAQTIALDQETAARLKQAQATYGRYAVLIHKKHISEQKFDQVKFDLAALKAHKVATSSAVKKAGAALKRVNIERDMASLVARFDGSITRRYLDEGTATSAGTPIIRLIGDQNLEIHVGLPGSAIPALVPEKTYIFTYHGGDITTKLRRILRLMDPATRTVTAIFNITDKNSNIRAGDLAQLAIQTDIIQDGFWVPNGALAESRRGLWSAYSLTPYKDLKEYATLSRQELQIIYMDGDRAFVRGTLREGDRIVTGGLHRLVPGQLVRSAEK